MRCTGGGHKLPTFNLTTIVATEDRRRFFGHTLRRPTDRFVLGGLSGSKWIRPNGQKRKFWTELVKDDLGTLGMHRQYKEDVCFHGIWNNDEWINSVQALAEDREG
ncbi:hypothetical protein RB195_014514 [Necator americanus]|uniref:Uncharacterized protein n=1 Tax=Necator americanus TaxID=51031 RepID=A0ABR1E0T3_NECAM